MFFYIGNNPPLQSLEKVSNDLYLDKGWDNTDFIWYKGYSTDCKISDNCLGSLMVERHPYTVDTGVQFSNEVPNIKE